jgi:heat-inducible transcriptional repressor
LVNFPLILGGDELSMMSNRLSHIFEGLTCERIIALREPLNESERLVTDVIIKIMRAEDEKENEESFMDGMQFMLKQPEFARTTRLTEDLMGLVEDKTITRAIRRPEGPDNIKVTIGNENSEQAVQEFSIITSCYGLEGQASGTISVIGPTRMEYDNAIATIRYLSLVMSKLVTELYGFDDINA